MQSGEKTGENKPRTDNDVLNFIGRLPKSIRIYTEMMTPKLDKTISIKDFKNNYWLYCECSIFIL